MKDDRPEVATRNGGAMYVDLCNSSSFQLPSVCLSVCLSSDGGNKLADRAIGCVVVVAAAVADSDVSEGRK